MLIKTNSAPFIVLGTSFIHKSLKKFLYSSSIYKGRSFVYSPIVSGRIKAASFVRLPKYVVSNSVSFSLHNFSICCVSIYLLFFDLFVVVGFALDDGTGAVELFGEDETHHLVRERQSRKGELFIGTGIDFR